MRAWDMLQVWGWQNRRWLGRWFGYYESVCIYWRKQSQLWRKVSNRSTFVEVKRHQRAQVTLARWLSPRQRRSWWRTGNFLVRGSLGGWYRIFEAPGSPVFRVSRRDPWRLKVRYCIAPMLVDLPEADIALAQALLLQTDEDRFLKTANVM